MPFYVTDRYGQVLKNPAFATFRQLLAQLHEHLEDLEHVCVSVTHESGWCLGAYASGRLVWENIEEPDGSPRHRFGVEEAEIVRLWETLARGEFMTIDRLPWRPGYGLRS